MQAIRLFLALLLIGASSASLAADPARYMDAELIAESLSPAPGRTILVGLRMTPRPGWHGYWSNPGDAGLVTSVRWTDAEGTKFGKLMHPPPVLLTADGISSYAHKGEHVLLSRMTVPRGLPDGTAIPVEAKLSWAACTATMCVPLHTTLQLELTAGKGEKGPHSAAIESARRKLPEPAPDGTFTSDGKTVRLVLPAAARLSRRSAQFFPDDNDSFKTALARAERAGSRIAITAPFRGEAPQMIGGVASDGRSAYRLAFLRGEAAGAAARDEAESAPEQAANAPASPLEIETAPEPATASAPKDSSRNVDWRWLALAVTVAACGALFVRRFPVR